MKILLALLLALCMVFTLCACGTKTAETTPAEAATSDAAPAATSESKPLEFVYITQDMANPYFVEVYNGFCKACEELGINVTSLDAKYDVAAQVTFIEDCVARNVDGMMISPLDDNALQAGVEEAKKAGIVVSAEAQPISNAQIDGSLDEYTYGYHIGESAANWINEKLGGKGFVLCIAQDDVESVIPRTDGIIDRIKELCPDAEIVARQNGSNTELAMSVTENILTAHPEVNVITTCDDYGGIGAYEAVNGMGKASDEFGIFAADATEEGIAKMKEEGSVYRSSVSIFPYDCGYEMAQAMYKYIMDGNNVDNTVKVVVERKYEPVLQSDVIG